MDHDEELLAIQMKEIAEKDMAANKRRAAWPESIKWHNTEKYQNNRSRGGRPSTRSKILAMLKEGYSVEDVIKELDCRRNLAHECARVLKMEQDAASPTRRR